MSIYKSYVSKQKTTNVINDNSSYKSMQIDDLQSKAKKLTIKENGQEVARAFIYLIENELGHNKPYALMEDVFVEEQFRSQGYGRKMVEAAIAEAKKLGCYKIIITSRHEREKVHQFYQRFGFKDYGKEFRMNLE